MLGFDSGDHESHLVEKLFLNPMYINGINGDLILYLPCCIVFHMTHPSLYLALCFLFFFV